MIAAVRPPLIPRWLASCCLRRETREAILGDLEERLQVAVARGVPVGRARWGYWRDALMSILQAPRVVPRTSAQNGALMSPSPRGSWFRGLGGDMRYVLRGLWASPGFVLVAVLSLAIGIGANVAMFSVIHVVLLQELPVSHPGELQFILWSHPKSSARAMNFGSNNASNYSYPAYQAVHAVTAGRFAICGYNFASQLTVSTTDQPASMADGMIVSGDYFPTLGLGVALGRPLEPQDDAPTAPHVAVISYGLWQRMFGGDVRAIGRTLQVNRVPFEIVGITPRAYHGLSIGGFFRATDVTLPIAAQPIAAPSFAGNVPLATDLSRRWLHVIARIPAGADVDGLHRDLVAALRRVDAAAAAGANSTGDTGVAFASAARGVDSISGTAQQPLTILAVISGLVLLIACANLAGIMLARGVARQRDLAVRRALGASRAVLVRQWVLESALLAGIGGAAGVIAAIWSGPVILRMLTTGLGPVALDLTLDRELLAIALGTTLVTALLCGALPALRLTRDDGGADLRTRVVGATSPKLTAGRVMIAVQVAISVPLVVGALLFIRTLHNLSGVDLGFDPHGLVTFHINPIRRTVPGLSDSMASPEEAVRTRTLLEGLEAVPGVTSATIFENALVSGVTSDTSVTVEGKKAIVLMNAVGPRFFETMRIPLLAGRAITIGDDSHARLVVVINHAFADQFFPGRSPIGASFLVAARSVAIVGVAADSVYDSMRHQARPMFYDSYLQRTGGTYYKSLAVRTRVSPAGVIPALRAAVADFDRDLPITDVKTQDEQIDDALGKERVFSRLLILFAVFALVLASIGLHGLTSYAVTRRTNEIGVRLALGAQRGQVLWVMLRQVVRLSAIGLLAGVPAAILLGRYVAALLYGVTPQDPVTVVLVACVLFAVAIAAGWLPARRAARMDALSALRHE